jgi:hypothetical protein
LLLNRRSFDFSPKGLESKFRILGTADLGSAEENSMRMIMHVYMPVDVFNAAVRDGSVGAKMQKILGEQKPEAAYFTEYHGQRSGILIVNLNQASEIPKFAEPWFLTFNAKVELHPAMTLQDLGASGLDAIGKQWS